MFKEPIRRDQKQEKVPVFLNKLQKLTNCMRTKKLTSHSNFYKYHHQLAHGLKVETIQEKAAEPFIEFGHNANTHLQVSKWKQVRKQRSIPRPQPNIIRSQSTSMHLIIGAKVSITKFTQSWYDTELFIQRNINLRGHNLQRWKPFGNTMDSFRGLRQMKIVGYLSQCVLLFVHKYA